MFTCTVMIESELHKAFKLALTVYSCTLSRDYFMSTNPKRRQILFFSIEHLCSKEERL